MGTKKETTNSADAVGLLALVLSAIGLIAGLIGLELGYHIVAISSALICLAASSLAIVAFARAVFKGGMIRAAFYLTATILLSCPPVCFTSVAVVSSRTRARFEMNHTNRYNMKFLREAVRVYANANDGRLPEAENWGHSLLEINPSLSAQNFKHPEHPEIVIAYNVNLSGLPSSDIPDDTVLFFVAKGAPYASGEQELLDADASASTAEIILMNGRIVTYWVEQGGTKGYNDRFLPVRWKP